MRFPTFLLLAPIAAAGPFSPAAGQPGSGAIPANDPQLSFWASGGEIERGPADITFEGSVSASFGSLEDAFGAADATPADPTPVVSLGDGGSVTLTFDPPVTDIPGPDFAVFENGFTAAIVEGIPRCFLELAHVEVSSDGVHFVRFPSTSLTQTDTQISNLETLDPTDIDQLAGKYVAGFGTPFDLARLRNLDPNLDLQRITHVRLIDVVGSIDPAFGTRDASGRLINAPHTTPFASGGFDLDAVGAFAATPTSYLSWIAAQDSADPAPDADLDGDGIPNLVAYLTGGAGLELSMEGSTIHLRHRQLSYREDARLFIETSTDLDEWDPLNEDVTRVESGGLMKQIHISLPAPAAPVFFRLAADFLPDP